MKAVAATVYVLTILLFSNDTFAQGLAFYIGQAKENSPLIQDNKNQSEASHLEVDRLRALYTKARITLTGNFEVSPVISRDNGSSTLDLNPTDAANYNGFDLATTNGGAYQGLLTVNQPLFNENRFRVSAEEAMIGAQINQNTIQLTEHDLERFITDQYIVCLQDYKQAQSIEALLTIVDDQRNIILKLVENGLARQSDLSLLTIEQKLEQASLNSFRSAYRKDLTDLRILCGISDTTYQVLEDINLQRTPDVTTSRFTERYRLDSLNLAATQAIFELQYKPALGLYGNAGLNAVYVPSLPNRFGISAGLNFSMTLGDGKQRSITRQRTSILMRSTRSYSSFFSRQNTVRKNGIITELNSVDERLALLEDQFNEYQKLLELYKQELKRGEIPVINYLTTLKTYLVAQREVVLLRSRKLSLINLYNYWNW
jgi:outer membrane protein TolC